MKQPQLAKMEEIRDLDSLGPEVGFGVIKNVGWSLGNYCNAKCEHCYSWQVRQSKLDITREDADTIVNKLVELGVETVNIGGNEPIFTNGPDWQASLLPYIVHRLHEAGIAIGITTYGITAKILYNHFRDTFYKVDDWDVSFDSPYLLEHDANRGQNIYKEAIEASRILAREKRTHSIIMCAMNMYLKKPKVDEDRVRRLVETAKQLGLSTEYIGFHFANAVEENGRVHVPNFDPASLDALLRLGKELDAEVRINTLKPTDPHHERMILGLGQDYRGFHFLIGNSDHIVVMGEPRYAALTNSEGNGCPCGSSSMRIHSKTPMGTIPVSPCVYMHEFKVEDLLTDPVLGKDGIVNRPEFRILRKRKIAIPDYCRDSSCELIETCRGGCATQAYFAEGEYIPEYMRIHDDITPKIVTRRMKPFYTQKTQDGLKFFYMPDGRKELARLWKPDPYSPKLARSMGTAAPTFPQNLPIGHDGMRVHENYLCTIIIAPK
ncbi:MAG: radical SAM protein [Candidatus Aenigmatarchaeota archaeon]